MVDFYEEKWESEIADVIGDDYESYQEKIIKTAKISLIEKFFERIGKQSSIAEVGCGSGRVIAYFQSKNSIPEAMGFDISYRAIEFARKHHPGISFQVLDIDSNSIPLDKNAVDVMLLCDIVEHVNDYVHLLDECIRVSRHVIIKVPLEKTFMEFGQYVLGMPSVHNSTHPHGHIHLFSRRSILKQLDDVKKRYPVEVEVLHAKQVMRTKYSLVNEISRLLFAVPAYHWIFPTDMGILISKNET